MLLIFLIFQFHVGADIRLFDAHRNAQDRRDHDRGAIRQCNFDTVPGKIIFDYYRRQVDGRFHALK